MWKVSIQDKNGNVETTIVRGSSDKEGHYEAKKFIEDELLPYYGLDEGKKVPLDFIMEEITFKKGDEITYLGFPGTIIAVNKEMTGDITYTVSYDKGTGKTTASNIPNKGEKIKMRKKGHPQMNEAKDKKKTPPIGKPKRGGSKKFYVYVRDPKTKRVKKVSFGAPGMSVGFKNPKRRKAFAARHKCGTGEPRTSARYWSCRVGRYAKQLGLGNNFSGFW